MNIIKSNWVCSLLIFLAGVILCWLYDRSNILEIIVYVIGAVFTTTGCINIISTQFKHNKNETGTVTAIIGWLAGLGGIGLGAAMLIVPMSFTKIIVYVFATLLVIGGLWHVFCLSYFYRKSSLPAWLYIPALIILVGGVVIFCSTKVRENVPVTILMTGIGSLIFSVETLLEYICSRHNADKAADLQSDNTNKSLSMTAVQKPAASATAAVQYDPEQVEIHSPDENTSGHDSTAS